MTKKEKEKMKKDALNLYAKAAVNYFGTNSRRD
jgi:hypothetical protein